MRTSKQGTMSLRITRIVLPLAILLAVALTIGSASAQQLRGAIYTTDKDGNEVNQNIYGMSTDVYLSGGPQNTNAAGLPDGAYFFQITDPPGKTLLSTDNAVCRQLMVVGGRVAGATGPPCKHANGTFNPANGATPVQMAPFSPTPNDGLEYKAWLIPTAKATISGSDPTVLLFTNANSKTDNFKAQQATVPPPGSCQPSSSLSAQVIGTNVTSYVPKGNWSVTPVTGVSVVNIEGSSIVPTLIPTANVVNSCASNPLTGTTVCTANNSDVYLLTGTTLGTTLTSSGSGSIGFSGGFCTNCGVAMDATHNKAVIGLSVGGAKGFQFLDLSGVPAFEPAFTSPSFNISEDPLLDPIRNLLLSASEGGNYEIADVTTTTSPAFFENATGGGELDSSGEDCTTGIILAPAEFSSPSSVFIADISNPTFAVFTPGAPGTWTAPSQNQILLESFLSAGASGIAVAQGTHTGVVSGEFGGDAVTAIALPSTSGGGAVPMIGDWVTCSIGSGFSNGFDPHTVTSYKSPSSGHAIALLANAGASTLAVVDLTNMLDPTMVPRTVGGHGCLSGTLPATVVSFVAVP